MTRIGDRLLLVLVVATALGAVLWWVVGFAIGELEGTTRLVTMVGAASLYVAALVGVWVWFGSRESEERPGMEGGRVQDEGEAEAEAQTAPGADVEQEADDRRR